MSTEKLVKKGQVIFDEINKITENRQKAMEFCRDGNEWIFDVIFSLLKSIGGDVKIENLYVYGYAYNITFTMNIANLSSLHLRGKSSFCMFSSDGDYVSLNVIYFFNDVRNREAFGKDYLPLAMFLKSLFGDVGYIKK